MTQTISTPATPAALPRLEAGQSWCCANGCGEAVPKVDQFEFSRKEDTSGNLLESLTTPVWVSTCCSASLFRYDEKTGESVDLDELVEQPNRAQLLGAAADPHGVFL
ncbi:TPA: hypothetical protein ACYLN4_000546 [Burkholderia lata]